MDFSYFGVPTEGRLRWFAERLRPVMTDQGHRYVEDPNQASLVLNFFSSDKPRAFRRKAQAVFVIGITEFSPPFDEPIRQGYPLLVRSLSNLFVGLVGNDGEIPDAHFVTLEQGHYVISRNRENDAYFRRVYDRVHPLASSQLVIDNIFEPDLEESLWEGDEITASISRAGKKLEGLNLLPAPFPLEEVLRPREIQHVKRLYGLGGLSYGNLSARKDATRFWMSASGVDKANLSEIGRDILMVKGYDPDRVAMLLSTPPGIEPRRVSVDAIEHWMIYREHPSAGAILHAHGWMEGVTSTDFNYPCGTRELGQAVADIVRKADDPSRCVVGLRNHGLTITGHSLDEIFERVEGKILTSVPMS